MIIAYDNLQSEKSKHHRCSEYRIVKNRKGIYLVVVCSSVKDAVSEFYQDIFIDVILKRQQDVLGPPLRGRQPVGIHQETEIGREHPLQPYVYEGHEAKVRPGGPNVHAVKPDEGVPDLSGEADPELDPVVAHDIVPVGEPPGVKLEGDFYGGPGKEYPVSEKKKA